MIVGFLGFLIIFLANAMQPSRDGQRGSLVEDNGYCGIHAQSRQRRSCHLARLVNPCVQQCLSCYIGILGRPVPSRMVTAGACARATAPPPIGLAWTGVTSKRRPKRDQARSSAVKQRQLGNIPFDGVGKVPSLPSPLSSRYPCKDPARSPPAAIV